MEAFVCPFELLRNEGEFTRSMPYWFLSNDVIVSELKDASLSQYIVFVFGNKFISWMIGIFTSTIALDTIGCTVANLENLPMQVKNRFLSVEKM